MKLEILKTKKDSTKIFAVVYKNVFSFKGASPLTPRPGTLPLDPTGSHSPRSML
jgi:hypothetical protein